MKMSVGDAGATSPEARTAVRPPAPRPLRDGAPIREVDVALSRDWGAVLAHQPNESSSRPGGRSGMARHERLRCRAAGEI